MSWPSSAMPWMVPLRPPAARFMRILKRYSPSSGKTWRAASPPCVPNGMSSCIRASCASKPSE